MFAEASLWKRMRSWLRWTMRRRLPRPLPILLEDLYAPAARVAYRSLRDWETDLMEAVSAGSLADDGLCDEVCAVARLARRYLMQVQRLRHGSRESPRDVSLRCAWETYHIDWSGFVLTQVERLTTATQPLLATHRGPATLAQREALREAMGAFVLGLEERLVAVDAVLAEARDLPPLGD